MTLPLLRGEKITYAEAIDEDNEDMLLTLSLPAKQAKFFSRMNRQRGKIKEVVSKHLGVSPEQCVVFPKAAWITGSFNLCVPVNVTGWSRKRVLIRFPLPFKVGEADFPGNSDEKIRCEAATYLWIGENCPDVPIPKLWGFGLGLGLKRTFSSYLFLPWHRRVAFQLTRWVRKFFGFSTPSLFLPDPSPNPLDIGYLIIDYIEKEEGTVLYMLWEEEKDNVQKRANLFRDVSRIILSLGRVALPRIGSFTIDDAGFVSLTNRPLTISIANMDNEGIATGIGRTDTYTCLQTYLRGLLQMHDNRLRYKPNAVNDDDGDGLRQMAALVLMRSKIDLVDPTPFRLSLTDCHQSNMFVDADWHVSHIIDLEWACSLGTTSESPIYRLIGLYVDETSGPALVKLETEFEEFMTYFQAEELRIRRTAHMSAEIHKIWKDGTFWIHLSLSCLTGFYNLFITNVLKTGLRSYSEASLQEIVSEWSNDAADVLTRKLDDKKRYTEKLQRLFEAKANVG